MGTKELKKLDKLQDRALCRIENCINPDEELGTKYQIEKLDIQRKRHLLRIMYNQSKVVENVDMISHAINLRNRGKIKLKKSSQV